MANAGGKLFFPNLLRSPSLQGPQTASLHPSSLTASKVVLHQASVALVVTFPLVRLLFWGALVEVKVLRSEGENGSHPKPAGRGGGAQLRLGGWGGVPQSFLPGRRQAGKGVGKKRRCWARRPAWHPPGETAYMVVSSGGV